MEIDMQLYTYKRLLGFQPINIWLKDSSMIKGIGYLMKYFFEFRSGILRESIVHSIFNFAFKLFGQKVSPNLLAILKALEWA